MKGIILAGGTGSRLYPLTKVTNKHLLPVGKCPMIYHPVMKLKKAGIKKILIVTGKEHMGDVVSLLGSGFEFNLEFTYRVQDQAGGIAEALGMAESFAGNKKIVVLLGDNIFEDDITPFVEDFCAQKDGAKVILKEVEDPERFGVAELQENKIISIEEKPKNPKSKYCVTGIYMYDNKVFRIIKNLKPSNRGELEISDVNSAYLNEGKLTYSVIKGWWTDAGTFGSLTKATELVNEMEKKYD